MPATLRIAIVGGSISGCTLANGLLHLENVTFDVFESKESFSERGAAIAMHTNALASLKSAGLDPDRILKDGLGNKRGVLQTIVGCGEHKGEDFLETIEGPWGLGRQQLLEQLVKTLPEERLHCNKKLVSIVEDDPASPLTLHFADGSTHTADAVIGSDGYRSKIREIILGKDHPDVAPRFAGFWDCRAMVPTEQAVEKYGTHLIDPRSQQLTAVAGDGCFTLSGPIAGGKMHFTNVTAQAPPDWDRSVWKMDLKREHLEWTYRKWDEKYRNGLIESVLSSGPGFAFNQWESVPAPTWFRGRICMMGDAAHATSNWLGQGAAQAMEDCSVLVNLFKLVECRDDIHTAFQAFDQVRRVGGRPYMVIEQSRLLGQISTGQEGLDPEGVKHFGIQAKRLEILSFDVDKQVDEARDYFQQLKRRTK